MIWLPALAALIISFLPSGWTRLIRLFALLATGGSLALAATVFAELWNTPLTGYRMVESLPWFPALGIQYKLGVDGMSLSLLLLTGLVSWTAIWMSFSIQERVKEFYVLTLIAISGVYGVFAAVDLFFFVVFYELASIPMYFLVGIWGSDKLGSGRPIYRETAATKLLLYLQLGGGIVLLGILALYFGSGQQTFDLQVLLAGKSAIAAGTQKLLFALFLVGFGIEAGLVPFHTWLPEGHSSAPTPLSMLLAGVLLKMGGYGLLRLGVQLLPAGAVAFAPVLATLGVVNILYGGLCALRQSDAKVMIAYSSVSHMGMFFLGLGALGAGGAAALTALTGAFFQLFSHGIITALLFAVTGAIYARTHSRDVRAWGGLAGQIPFLSFFFVAACMGSAGLPGLTGFVAEFMVLLGTAGYQVWLVVAALPGLLLTTLYLLRAVQYGIFGPLNPDHQELRDAGWSEKIPMLILGASALWFGLVPSWVTSTAIPLLTEVKP